MKNMSSFEVWQVTIFVVQTCILLATMFLAFYIGLKQNEINQRLVDISYAELQPVLSFKPEYQDPFKFVNVGKGPAFNVYLLQGNISGDIFMNTESSTLSLQGVGVEGFIKKKDLLPVSIEDIEAKIPYVKTEIEKAVSKKINWMALVYGDLNGQNLISINFGNSNFTEQAIVYKRLLK